MRCALALAATALFLICLGRFTDVDLYLADRMYDFASKKFLWRNNWFAAVFMHEWLKVVLISIGLALTASLVVDRTFSSARFNETTRRRLYVVVSSCVLVPLSVSIVKSVSIHSCPWDLTRYGGVAPYLRIFDALPANAVAGHCFPAGHASSALWLASFAVFWLPARPIVAAMIFSAGLMSGVLLGWIQQMRGAHFLTHTLWSAWIASLVMVCLIRMWCASHR